MVIVLYEGFCEGFELVKWLSLLVGIRFYGGSIGGVFDCYFEVRRVDMWLRRM